MSKYKYINYYEWKITIVKMSYLNLIIELCLIKTPAAQNLKRNASSALSVKTAEELSDS